MSSRNRGNAGDDSEQPVPAPMVGVVSGESVPPDEHTRRIAARKGGASDPADDADRIATVVGEPPEENRSHRAHAAASKATPAREGTGAAQKASSSSRSAEGSRVQVKTTREMAERTVRQRRRDRDRRAERSALAVVIVLFAGFGLGGLFLLNSEPEDEPGPKERAEGPPKVEPHPVRAPRAPQIDETPDIPALNHLRSEGLTIAAEGVPKVTAEGADAPMYQLYAAQEACRFAYGVWEFSPNDTFRFLTTCSGFEGQVLVGGYEIQGTVVRMSPLQGSGPAPTELVSEFQVEKPSKMLTAVTVRIGNKPIVLKVEQRITTMESRMAGEAFHDAYVRKNTFEVPAQLKSHGER